MAATRGTEGKIRSMGSYLGAEWGLLMINWTPRKGSVAHNLSLRMAFFLRRRGRANMFLVAVIGRTRYWIVTVHKAVLCCFIRGWVYTGV